MDDIFKTQDHTDEFTPDDIQSNNVAVMALTYILPFLPFIVSPNSQYAKFHANQGLICWISGIVLSVGSMILCRILSLIPLIRLFLPFVVNKLVGVIILLIFVFGIVNALNQRAKDIPFVGQFRIIK
jgi:uncharacterized membrane protein